MCLSSVYLYVGAHDQISQAFPLYICILQVIDYDYWSLE